MMKKILAAAIVSAFAAPAFAATANVDIYGQANVSVDSVDADGALNERRSRVSSNNSHIGFKGAEDLGGGLSAVWQYEFAILLDQSRVIQNDQGNNDSRGQSTVRNSFAGLSSKTLGSLTFGTQNSPLRLSTAPLTVYTHTLADHRSVFAKLSTRADSSILYTSPSLGGFVAKVMYGARNEAGNGTNPDPRMYALSGVYTNGPLYATLAYENNKNTRNAAGIVNTGSFSPTTGLPIVTVTPAVTALSSTVKAWRAGVGYTFGNTKLGLAYENNDAENLAGVTTNDGDAWYASVAHKMGNITLNGAYTKRSDYLSTSNDGADQMTVGVDYNLSKRTMVYALYTQVDNEGNALTGGTNNIGQSSGIATVSTVAGGDASGFSLGMSHKF